MDYYEEIELPIVTVLEIMELNVTYVDIEILSDMSKKNDKESLFCSFWLRNRSNKSIFSL